MRGKKRQRLVVAFVPIAVAVGLVACDESPSVVAPAMEDQAVLVAMEAAIQDEFRAELIYEKVLDGFGPVRPFVNIVNAEPGSWPRSKTPRSMRNTWILHFPRM